jgi:Mrp family chromosome partitioning ATPase
VEKNSEEEAAAQKAEEERKAAFAASVAAVAAEEERKAPEAEVEKHKAAGTQVYLLSWYKSAHTDTEEKCTAAEAAEAAAKEAAHTVAAVAAATAVEETAHSVPAVAAAAAVEEEAKRTHLQSGDLTGAQNAVAAGQFEAAPGQIEAASGQFEAASQDQTVELAGMDREIKVGEMPMEEESEVFVLLY